jgi:hypothetical protein
MKVCKYKSFDGYSIIDKKQWLTKVSEPSETYQHLIIDTLMYAKHKIMCGSGIDIGIVDLLKKTKVGLLKVVQSQEYLNKILLSFSGSD